MASTQELLQEILRNQHSLADSMIVSNTLSVLGRFLEVLIATAVVMIYFLKVQMYRLQRESMTRIDQIHHVIMRERKP